MSSGIIIRHYKMGLLFFFPYFGGLCVGIVVGMGEVGTILKSSNLCRFLCISEIEMVCIFILFIYDFVSYVNEALNMIKNGEKCLLFGERVEESNLPRLHLSTPNNSPVGREPAKK